MATAKRKGPDYWLKAKRYLSAADPVLGGHHQTV